MAQTDRDTNFAYESATTRQVGGNPADPFQTAYNFEGQIGLFRAINGRFLPTDVVTVTFGGVKAGLLRGPGATLAGRIELVDVGIADDLAATEPLVRT